MKKFIVIDKGLGGVNWVNDSMEEVFEATQCNTLDEMKDIYELIEVVGEFELNYLVD